MPNPLGGDRRPFPPATLQSIVVMPCYQDTRDTRFIPGDTWSGVPGGVVLDETNVTDLTVGVGVVLSLRWLPSDSLPSSSLGLLDAGEMRELNRILQGLVSQGGGVSRPLPSTPLPWALNHTYGGRTPPGNDSDSDTS